MTPKNHKALKKELSLIKIYSLATGATLSSGFFLLPGIAAAAAGPAVSISYLIAALLFVPGVLSTAELATAMPRAGGMYYFVDRSLGPMFGTIGGMGTWLALILKTAFALVGMGAYISLFVNDLPIVEIACGLAVVFGGLNYFGTKKSGGFQVILVTGLMLILGVFLGYGMSGIRLENFANYWGAGFDSIFATTGLVYISYAGLTKIASVSEEVENPEKNLPLGMLLALITAVIIYLVGTAVMVGVLAPDKLHNDLTPVATTARALLGDWGAILLTIAAILAFFSVANAAILSASRYPMAMSRDRLLPDFLKNVSKHGTPGFGILLTVILIVLCLLLFNPIKIAKLASAFQLILFAMACLSVIIMRESRIESYDPGFRSPLYPWVQLVGIIAPIFLIFEMGFLPILFTVGLFAIGILWYFYYARDRVVRDGAIYHIFARLGEHRFEGLDHELRGILKEKGLRAEDPFEAIIARAVVIDIAHSISFEKVVHLASIELEKRIKNKESSESLKERFMLGTRLGATPVSHGVALPHLRLKDIDKQEMVIVRTKKRVKIEVDQQEIEYVDDGENVFAFFFLISPEDDPSQHLRLLAEIASRVENENFNNLWFAAADEQELKEIFHHDDRFVSLVLKKGYNSEKLIDKEIWELSLPEGSLITIIYRDGQIFIPRGRTQLRENDRLTIIGELKGIQQLKDEFMETIIKT
ncbi:MAG: amino acid permease [Calditrichaeota bacterium]|nr:MAG: amino acid permease [Calditrichota bacterium]